MRTGKKQAIARAQKGQFAKGVSGNPGGRPSIPEDLKEAFKANAPLALDVLVGILTDKEARNADRLRAAEIILDRAWGKPTQAVDLKANTFPQVVIMGEVPD